MPAATAKLAAYRFSADDVPERDREAIWRETYARPVIGLDFERLGNGPFRCEVALRTHADLAVGSIATTGMRISRDRELVAADLNDTLYVNLIEEGVVVPSQAGRVVRADKGDVVVMTGTETGTIDCPSTARFLSFHVPRAALAPLVPNIDDAVMRPVVRNEEAVRLLAGYGSFLRRGLSSQMPELQHLAVTHVYDLIVLTLGLTLGATRDAAEVTRGRGVRTARLAAIKADIARNLDREDLSVGTVARRQGLTPRYVQILFDGEGTTFSEFVLCQRIARARCLLTHPRFAHWRISSIAYHVGFGDLSYFNRSFRRIFGATPSEVRKAASARRPGEDADDAS